MSFVFAALLIALLLIQSTPWIALGCFGWFVGISAFHGRQEISGKLWEYFGRTTGNKFVNGLGPFTGPLFIVLPAFTLQATAAWNGFMAQGKVPAFWIAMLIGARIGDALFSHFLPNAKGFRPNPGYASAVIYLIDGLVLLAWSHDALASEAAESLKGGVIGAGFFALIQPAMRLTANYFQSSLPKNAAKKGGQP